MEMDYQESKELCSKLELLKESRGISPSRRPGRPRKSLNNVEPVKSIGLVPSPPIKMWEIAQELSSESNKGLSSIDPRFKNAIQARRTRERKKEEEKILREKISQLSQNLSQANQEIQSKDSLITNLAKEKELLEQTVQSQCAMLEKFKDEILLDLNRQSSKNNDDSTVQNKIVVLCPGLLAQEQEQAQSNVLDNSKDSWSPTPSGSGYGLAKVSYGNLVYYDAVRGNQLPKLSSSTK